MKKILCLLMAFTMCASAAAVLSGCGDSGSGVNPGYKVEPTEPDITNGDFGYFIINNDELMLTKYTGSSKDIEIPETYNNYKVTVVGSSLFNGSDIESVTFPSSIREIKDYAFASCHSLTSVTFSEGLETLGTGVFFNCSALKEISLPSSLKDLGTRSFSGSSINNVVLPSSGNLTQIGDYVFYQCRELTDITIPSCITSISETAFNDCAKAVTVHGDEGGYVEQYVKEFGSDNNLTFASTGVQATQAATAAETTAAEAAEVAE